MVIPRSKLTEKTFFCYTAASRSFPSDAIMTVASQQMRTDARHHLAIIKKQTATPITQDNQRFVTEKKKYVYKYAR